MKVLNKIFRIFLSYLLGLMIIFPLLWMLISSFKESSEIINHPFSIPSSITGNNYRAILNIPDFIHILFNTSIIAILVTIFVAAISLPVSYMVSRYTFPYKSAIKFFTIIGAYLFSPAILVFPYFSILSTTGLLNSKAGVIFTHIAFCLPFAMTVGDLIFRSVPIELEEIALLDYSSSIISRITKIIIPAAKPQIIALLFLIFAISWKEFFYVFVVTSDSSAMTLSVLLAGQYGAEGVSWGVLFSLSSIMILPSIIVLFFAHKIKFSFLIQAGTKG